MPSSSIVLTINEVGCACREAQISPVFTLAWSNRPKESEQALVGIQNDACAGDALPKIDDAWRRTWLHGRQPQERSVLALKRRSHDGENTVRQIGIDSSGDKGTDGRGGGYGRPEFGGRLWEPRHVVEIVRPIEQSTDQWEALQVRASQQTLVRPRSKQR